MPTWTETTAPTGYVAPAYVDIGYVTPSWDRQEAAAAPTWVQTAAAAVPVWTPQ